MDPLASIFKSLAVQALEGLGVFYGVYRFFKTIDENLSVDAKSSIADWILSSTQTSRGKTWPETFSIIFNKVFGEKQLSWKCASRSAIVTFLAMFLIAPWFVLSQGTAIDQNFILFVVPIQISVGLIPNFVCILVTRGCIALMKRLRAIPLMILILLIVSYAIVAAVGMSPLAGDEVASFLHANSYPGPEPFAGLTRDVNELLGITLAALFAASVSLIWLWLFVISGLILRAARFTKIGFNTFSRVLDLKGRPLACLGLVAGALCALCWWVFLTVGYYKNSGT